jgi:hypothetical protein
LKAISIPGYCGKQASAIRPDERTLPYPAPLAIVQSPAYRFFFFSELIHCVLFLSPGNPFGCFPFTVTIFCFRFYPENSSVTFKNIPFAFKIASVAPESISFAIKIRSITLKTLSV